MKYSSATVCHKEKVIKKIEQQYNNNQSNASQQCLQIYKIKHLTGIIAIQIKFMIEDVAKVSD